MVLLYRRLISTIPPPLALPRFSTLQVPLQVFVCYSCSIHWQALHMGKKVELQDKPVEILLPTSSKQSQHVLQQPRKKGCVKEEEKGTLVAKGYPHPLTQPLPVQADDHIHLNSVTLTHLPIHRYQSSSSQKTQTIPAICSCSIPIRSDTHPYNRPVPTQFAINTDFFFSFCPTKLTFPTHPSNKNWIQHKDLASTSQPVHPSCSFPACMCAMKK
ncbi:hypothetical protein HRR82_009584 [Exophiala dermatitidis]|nr:hypothetical protein HRR82_009584 [Exophiala dermatitidis]